MKSLTEEMQTYRGVLQEADDDGDTFVSRIIRRNYEFGECPDCGEEIPLDVCIDQGCGNCGHVFSACCFECGNVLPDEEWQYGDSCPFCHLGLTDEPPSQLASDTVIN